MLKRLDANRLVRPRKPPTGKQTDVAKPTRSKISRQKIEKDLEEGYLANAASARVVAEEMMGAEADFS